MKKPIKPAGDRNNYDVAMSICWSCGEYIGYRREAGFTNEGNIHKTCQEYEVAKKAGA